VIPAGFDYEVAESVDHARQMVPWYLREKARIVMVVKFGPASEVHKPK